MDNEETDTKEVPADLQLAKAPKEKHKHRMMLDRPFLAGAPIMQFAFLSCSVSWKDFFYHNVISTKPDFVTIVANSTCLSFKLLREMVELS